MDEFENALDDPTTPAIDPRFERDGSVDEAFLEAVLDELGDE